MEPLTACWGFVTSSDRVNKWLKERLKEELIHLFTYDARVTKLEGVVKKLKEKREKIQNKIHEEENRYDRGIPPEVKGWLKEVDETISKYEKFDGDKCWHEVAKFDLITTGYLPKPGIRHHRSREAYDITKQVNVRLAQTEKLDALSYLLVPPSLTALLHNVGYESFPSREEAIRKINAALEDPSVRMIGLYGWSGVGKTTLVKEIARKALQASEGKPKMFNAVAIANVTRNPDIRKIQGQIADMLGMALEDESDIARAARIRKRLRSEKESTLIILDNLWETLDFNMLGIPLVSDADDYDDGEHSMTKPPAAKEVSSENFKKGKTPGKQGMTKPGMEVSSENVKMENDINMKNFETLPNASSMKTKEALSRYNYKGCNVLLISEMKEVLLSQLEGNEKSIYSLDVLKENEAETLFKKKAGIGGGADSKTVKLAAQIANKCNGLPMTIVTTARALKNQSQLAWEDVLRQLESNKSIAAPEFSTRLSYDHLENEELKDTFLLCARMGPDAFIMDLVKYCIGLGFLRGTYTVRETRSRVYALVGRLKVLGLLSDSYSRDHFTMPDIVRRAALSIAFKDEHVLTMIKEKLDEWPDEDKLARYTAISLHHCDIIKGFPTSINCPKLRVFHLDNNDLRLKIPENLFEGMKELKVLILTGMNLSSFPSSIRCLSKLRMLCLEQCELGEKLSIIGELTNLRILSLSGSNLKKLPAELKHLTMLQMLDISNCSKLREIPSVVISSLIRLEELYMRNTLIQWEVEGQINASLSDLKHLHQLTSLDMQIRDVSYLVENLFFDKLANYTIVVGELDTYLEMDFKMPEKYEASRFLAIQFKDGFDIHFQRGIKMLFGSVETLFLEEVNRVKDIFYTLNLKGFPYLKHLLIVNDSDIQYLINPTDERQEKVFPKLESLYLYDLKKMEKICSYKLSEPFFGSLKVIKINLCGQLKHVFLFSMVSLLTVLETFEVSECNALSEIVYMDEQRNTNKSKPEFPKLLSLTLQSLSEFTGFYSPSEGETTPALFHEKVVLSNLERMVVSSIQIDKIWSDQHSHSSCHFGNLIHVDVNGCSNLTYLIPFSMAQCLVKLQNLFVSDCQKMKHIFQPGQGSREMKGPIFPSLKNIKLSSMKSLSKIWDGEFRSDSFGKLDTLIIEECDKLVNVFPCCTEGVFQSLCNLRVTNCRLMKEIFVLDDNKQNDGDVTNLKDVHLETLPKLDHIWKWNKGWDEILKLTNLQKICVKDCESLENIFPVSVKRRFNNLEYLVVSECLELKEIVAKGEDTKVSFEFPKLATINISGLPKLGSFYAGACELSFPALNDLCIERCYRLEPFIKESPLFTVEVINRLKSMQIESWHVMSPTSYKGKGSYRRDNLEELCLSRLRNTEILYSFLHSNPFLKSLSLSSCSLTEIEPPSVTPEREKYGVVPELKSLKLTDLPNLDTIGFQRDIILQRIESLIVNNCPSLVNIIPSSVSLTYLTTLEVINCNGLETLMSSTAAKSLVQLNTMKAIRCASLVEIVGNEEKNAGEVDIVFRKLKVLELVSLNNLNSFSSSESCVFEFPSLEKLVVSACPKMEIFSKQVKNTTSLQKIYVVPHEQEKRRLWCWKGDLNAIIREIFEEKRYFEGMGEISVSEHPDLHQAWLVEVQRKWFYSLKLYKCITHEYAIPSYILPYLKNLEELEVRDCYQVRVIFDMSGTQLMETSSRLKILTLENLPELTHVWRKSCKGILRFQNLQYVSVKYCDNLQTLFPAALAKYLKKLVKLKIEFCGDMRAIVGMEDNTTAETIEKFEFPHLTLLHLYDLPKLTCFYPQTFTMKCPMLKQLLVLNCYKLELFQSAHPEIESEGSSTSVNKQSLFLDLRAISNLEQLYLDWKHIPGLRLRLRSMQLTGVLEHLREISLSFDVDKNEKPIFPYEILEKAPKLEYLIVKYCISIKMFLTQNPEISEFMRLLKSLTLFRVSKLQSIGLADSSWLNIVCEKLHKLVVYKCPDLSKLLHPTSAASFSNLKELCVTECHGLKYLFSFSMVAKLKSLEKIQVKECNLIKELVTKEGGETMSQGVKFEKLDRITLNSLSSLECFYSGNDTLHLPFLAQVDIWHCPKMEIFSQGSIQAKYFRGIQASSDSNDELVFHDDLNSSVKRVFLRQMFAEGIDNMSFSKHLELKQAWEDGANWFCGLKTLKLKKYDIHPYAIPHNILPYLKSLQELEVHNCDQVEVIFDMTGTETVETSFQLKILTLEGLPKLTHVWDKNHVGIVGFQNLQQVTVRDCKTLQNMFPAVLAKSLKKLEKLHIESCSKIKEIVGKIEDATAEMPEEFVFPCLSSLYLYDLQMLNYFYPETFTLQCPLLNSLFVMDCHKLELFQSVHLNVEGEGSSASISRLPLFSNLNAVSKLEELVLDRKHISWLRSEKLTEELIYLKEIRLLLDVDDIEELVLPYEVLEKAPNLYEMSIGWCKSIKIFLTQNPKINVQRMLGHLKILTLNNVSELHSMGFEDSSWLNLVCENLHKLTVYACPDLSNLLSSTSAIAFTNLKLLYIVECHALEYLFTSSVAEKFMRLEGIAVENCSSIKGIVANDGDRKVSQGIKFEWLNHVYLKSLPSLECFYLGNDTLQLPSLEIVIILQCPKMQFFSEGLIHTEYFRGIQGSSNSGLGDLVFCKDLNTSVKKAFLQQEHLVFGDSPLLKAIWLKSEINLDWSFRNLNSLVMEGCDFLSNVILPSHILPLLSNLKKLEVRECNSVKAIFVHTKMGPQGSLNLPFLEELTVEVCEELVEIVAKDETATEEANEEVNLFPNITSLELTDLPKLRCIYPEMPIQEWPMLKVLQVVHCQMLKFFTTKFQNSPDSHLEYRHSFPTDQQADVSLTKVTPHLEKLSLGVEEANLIEQGKLHVDLQNLDTLIFQCFHDDSDVFPFVFHSKKASLPTTKRLVLVHSDFKEIFPSQSPVTDDYSKIFSHLEELTLWKLRRLESIGLENFWIRPFLDKLLFLAVDNCGCLTNLSPSTVCFTNLKGIKVQNCQGLKYLFTSSTAKTLHALELMVVTNCGSLQKVVMDEDEVHKDDIITFEKLETLTLSNLPNLESFYWGSSALNISSLKQVSFTQCSTARIFRLGDSIPKELEVTIDGTLWNDINSAIVQREHLVFRNSPLLNAIWLKSEIDPDLSFRNLNSLVMEGCEFLSNVILPSHILPLLSNLKKLEVRKCNYVKAIFVHTKMGPQGNLSLPFLELLKVVRCEELVEIVAKDERTTEEANEEFNLFPNITSLTLLHLPKLRCIYPEMPIQEWPMLKSLHVIHCQMLKFFTTKFQNSPDSHLEYQHSFPMDQQADVSLTKVTPRLDKLSLSVEEANLIEQGKLHVDLQNLDTILLQCFHDDSDVFPFVFHSKKASLPTTKRLVLRHSGFKQIFPSQSPVTDDYSKIFSHLEELMLVDLPWLESIGLENYWIRPFLDKLLFLAVDNCGCLTNLTPSTVSFSNLTQIQVYDCEGLEYLFTSSTAKTLRALEWMIVTNCGSLQKVVMDEDEVHKDGTITFEKLETLTLSNLPNLESFYSGSYALNISSLKEVSFTQCGSTKVFRLDDIVPKELEVTIDEIPWEGDINSAIMQQIEEEAQPQIPEIVAC